MNTPFERHESAASIIIRALLMEAPFLIGGIVAYFLTGNWMWLIGGLVTGGAFWVPAIGKLKRIQERNNASR